MRTTRDVNVDLSRSKLRLRHVTTKNIDVGVRVEPPKAPIKKQSLTTTTMQDVADVAEKKRRDDIAKEIKLAKKDEKKIVIAKKEITFVAKKLTATFKAEKKPWNKMNAKERKAYQAEKARKK